MLVAAAQLSFRFVRGHAQCPAERRTKSRFFCLGHRRPKFPPHHHERAPAPHSTVDRPRRPSQTPACRTSTEPPGKGEGSGSGLLHNPTNRKEKNRTVRIVPLPIVNSFPLLFAARLFVIPFTIRLHEVGLRVPTVSDPSPDASKPPLRRARNKTCPPLRRQCSRFFVCPRFEVF